MKKLIIILVLLVLVTKTFSQTVDPVISEALSQIERQESQVNNIYLQGKFMGMIKNGKSLDLLKVYNEPGFIRCIKVHDEAGEWNTFEIKSDNAFLEMINEVRKNLPSNIQTRPSQTEYEELFDSYVTDSWYYTDKKGRRCEVTAYFINNQLVNMLYRIEVK
jgi:hypothetical protein